jgi:hypothetical protein
LTHPNQVVHDTEEALVEFRKVNSGEGQQQREITATIAKGWTPPPANMVKINWDASLDKNGRIVGMGLIARDGRGTVLAAATKAISSNVDPVVAEALAATHAFLMAYELGFQQVIF